MSNILSVEHLEHAYSIRVPKVIAKITLCGSMTITIDDTMNFTKPTPEQIKNLHDLFCIDVELIE